MTPERNKHPEVGDILAIHRTVVKKIDYAVVKEVTEFDTVKLTTMKFVYVFQNDSDDRPTQDVTYEDWWKWINFDDDYIVTDSKEIKEIKLLSIE